MAIEIVSFPSKNGGFVHRYVNVYQRVPMLDFTIQDSNKHIHKAPMTSDHKYSSSAEGGLSDQQTQPGKVQ